MTSNRVGGDSDVSLLLAANLVRESGTALILTHRNPDGDAIGSAAALAAGIRALGKSATIVCPDPVPDYLLAVPGASDIVNTVDGSSWDIVITVDVSDPALLKPLPCADVDFFKRYTSLNLDHHFSNLHYAQFNYVDSTAASATEIIADLVHDQLGVPYSPDIASDLLFGIVNDTHSFQNSNTTARVLRLSADLVEAGADLSRIAYTLLLEKRPEAARLWAQVLPSLIFADDGRVAFLTVSLDALARAGASMTDADGLVEFLRSIRRVDLAALFKQTDVDHYRLSLRTSPAVDATVIAGVFGGGGHQRAAGGDATGELPQVQRQLLEAYKASRTELSG